MPSHDWRPFLFQFSREILADDDLKTSLPADVASSGWLGGEGATEAQIAEVEARLGVSLPPSYREFLAVTDGWLNIGAFLYRLWPSNQIDWFKVRNQWAIDAWIEGESYGASLYSRGSITDEEYNIYGEDQDPVSMRSEYLSTALEVSDWGDAAILLLNPQVVFDDGEWEAWFHASWLPGARRYRSFWEMMLEEYRGYLRLKNNSDRG